jgi:hypothetical protein
VLLPFTEWLGPLHQRWFIVGTQRDLGMHPESYKHLSCLHPDITRSRCVVRDFGFRNHCQRHRPPAVLASKDRRLGLHVNGCAGLHRLPRYVLPPATVCAKARMDASI